MKKAREGKRDREREIESGQRENGGYKDSEKKK